MVGEGKEGQRKTPALVKQSTSYNEQLISTGLSGFMSLCMMGSNQCLQAHSAKIIKDCRKKPGVTEHSHHRRELHNAVVVSHAEGNNFRQTEYLNAFQETRIFQNSVSGLERNSK